MWWRENKCAREVEAVADFGDESNALEEALERGEDSKS